MAIHRDARRCVGFVGSQVGASGTARIKPYGTGFFLEGGNVLGGGMYFVTARHIASQLDYPAVIRLNKTGGGAGVIELESEEAVTWYYPEDESIDLAVTPLQIPEWSDAKAFSANHSLRPGKMETKNIEAGDLAHVVGLFHLLHGAERNLPIVHTGHIAMLPGEERIPVNSTTVEGYLVEANAISGCSGSPVFVQRSIHVLVPGEMQRVKQKDGSTPGPLVGTVPGSIWLLGVWQSSWKVKGSEIVAVRTDSDYFQTAAPLGMGVVVPVAKLLDLLQRDDLKALRA